MYEAGADVRALLPTLSVYLGHVRPQDTYQHMAKDHTCKGVGECHPYREFEGMQPSR